MLFIFKDTDEQDSLSTALCAILHQLFARRPQLIRHASDAYDDIQHHIGKILEDLPVIRLHREDENGAVHAVINLVVRPKVIELAAEFKLAQDAATRLETKLFNMEHRTYLWL